MNRASFFFVHRRIERKSARSTEQGVAVLEVEQAESIEDVQDTDAGYEESESSRLVDADGADMSAVRGEAAIERGTIVSVGPVVDTLLSGRVANTQGSRDGSAAGAALSAGAASMVLVETEQGGVRGDDPRSARVLPTYFMESTTEGDRLELKTDTIAVGEHLLRSGLQLGMPALDVACGAGAVTRVMAKITGPGHAVGVDMSRSRVAQARMLAARERVGVEFTEGTAEHLPFADESFGFTHARFLFEYLVDPRTVLAEMRRVTRPGGWVVVTDLDGQIDSLYPMGPQLADDVHEALRLLGAIGFDPQVGRKLRYWFGGAGLEDVSAWVTPYQVYSGNLPERDVLNWREKLATSVAFLVKQTGESERWQRFEQRYLEALQAPESFYFSTQITVRGRVAEGGDG